MQTLIIAGNIGKDAELRTTQGGDKVCSFSVAVDNGKDKQGNRRDSTWYECSLWGKRAESMSGYITKGGKVTVTGRPTCRVYNEKAYMGLSVDNITLQGGRSEGGGQHNNQGGSGGYDQSSGYNQGGRPGDDMDDEIPFAPEFR